MKASKDKKDLAQSSGGKYITASGCYPVNIIAPFASTSSSDSTVVDFWVNYNDQEQVIYGNLRVTNKGGTTNEIGAKVFNQLMIIADVEEVDEPVDGELPIGKAGAMKDAAILEDLADIDVIMRIQLEYSVFNENIQETKAIRGFFRAEDNASAEEIVNESEAGVQYAKEAKYFENVTYKDGLDADIIAKWVADGRPKGTGGKAGATTASAKKPAFGKKRSFGKKD